MSLLVHGLSLRKSSAKKLYLEHLHTFKNIWNIDEICYNLKQTGRNE